MKSRMYLCIDLKSFYASVECVERGLDPMTAKLVVADPERSDKTICLAITPAMKALGIRNRCRIFEIPKSTDYIVAEPRMKKYIEYAAEIYGIYLRYLSKDDIYVYSIDEAFLDVTAYLNRYGLSPREMAQMLMNEVLKQTGIRATCGIGTNLYLTKVALDITAKHSPDFIGILDEESYRDTLWSHTPLTDFWRIGPGTAARLEKYGLTTMGQIARFDEDILYKVFGIDAELLIDHAWGREPTTIADIKAYKPKTNCLCSGQVLMRDYSYEEGLLIVKEMTDLLCLDLTDKELVTASVSLQIGYSNALHSEPSGGTTSFHSATDANSVIIPALTELYGRITSRTKPVRRISISFNNITSQDESRMLTLFDDEAAIKTESRSRQVQKAILSIKKKYGNDSMLKGMNLEPAATTRERNHQIGGHKSGT